jgi:cob(I)alamin adenosyltransferase
VIGADMATPYSTNKSLKILRIELTQVSALEEMIDKLETELDPIRNFILPGGSELGAMLHQARAICRRAERSVVYISEAERINPNVVVYLNRLSDLLFVTARYVNKKLGEEETPWITK